jgi:hypothetical protein
MRAVPFDGELLMFFLLSQVESAYVSLWITVTVRSPGWMPIIAIGSVVILGGPMGHSKVDKAKTHKRILAIASKRFREDGLAVWPSLIALERISVAHPCLLCKGGVLSAAFRFPSFERSAAFLALCVPPLTLSFLPLAGAHPWFLRVGSFEHTIHFFRRFTPQLLSNL